MPRNVEIKACVRDFNSLLEKAKKLSSSKILTFTQEDTFFNVPNGRLKARKQEGCSPQLVFYDRSDADGPKLSDYEICRLPDDTNLSSVLTRALGIKGVLRKTRTLCIIDQTRVHLDVVEDLGNFMELEVVLRDDQCVEEGQKIAEDLMKELGISKDDLVSGAYMDHILKNKEKQ